MSKYSVVLFILFIVAVFSLQGAQIDPLSKPSVSGNNSSLFFLKDTFSISYKNIGINLGLNEFSALITKKTHDKIMLRAKANHFSARGNSILWDETEIILGCGINLEGLSKKDDLDFDDLFSSTYHILSVDLSLGFGNTEETDFTSRSFDVGYLFILENKLALNLSASKLFSTKEWDTTESIAPELHFSTTLLSLKKTELSLRLQSSLEENFSLRTGVSSTWKLADILFFTGNMDFERNLTLFSGGLSFVKEKYFAGLLLEYPLGFILSTSLQTGIRF